MESYIRIAFIAISCTYATFLGPRYPMGPPHPAMIHPPMHFHLWHKYPVIGPVVKPHYIQPVFHPPIMRPFFKPVFKPKPFLMPKPFFKKMKPMYKPKMIFIKKVRLVKPPKKQIRPRIRHMPRPNNFRYVRPTPRRTYNLPVPVFRRNVFTGYRPPTRRQRIDIPQIRTFRPPRRIRRPSIRTYRPRPTPSAMPVRRDYSAQPVRRETGPTQRIRQWIQAAHGIQDDEYDDDDDEYDDDDDDDFEDYWEDRLEQFEESTGRSRKHYYDNDDDDRSDEDFVDGIYRRVNSIGFRSEQNNKYDGKGGEQRTHSQNTQYHQTGAAFVQQINNLVGAGRTSVAQQHRISSGKEQSKNSNIAELRSKYLENLAEKQSKYDASRRNHPFSSGSNI